MLFADLVGFTTFSETADPEHVKNLVDRCFDRLATDVTAYGGQVDKIVGDAIVACFGAPVAHEDDAERAVRAGLQMQRTLAELRDVHQIGAEMRVGVNTGEVLVGALRAGGDYTAMGDAVNTASRLQTLAEPGQVLVGPATHEATRTHVRYEPVGCPRPRGAGRGLGRGRAGGAPGTTTHPGPHSAGRARRRGRRPPHRPANDDRAPTRPSCAPRR
jgi:class 3 adenylate cyclase